MHLDRRSETDDDALVVEVEREYTLSLAGFRNALLHALNVGALLTRKRDSLDYGEWLAWFEPRGFKKKGLDIRQAQKLIFL